MNRNEFFKLYGLTIALLVTQLSVAHAAPSDSQHLHRPVAIESIGQRLVVANRDSGSLALIDLPKDQVVTAFTAKLADRISDIATIGDEEIFVADPAENQILHVRLHGNTATVQERVSVPASPVRLSRSSNGDFLVVACHWARQLVLLEVDRFGSQTPCTLDLDFSPRELLFANDSELIVTDAFGGRIAIVDIGKRSVVADVEIPGHNIRGLTFEPKTGRLMLAHQLINGFLPNSRDHVFWGNVVTNLMRYVEVDKIQAAVKRKRIHGAIYPLGQERDGAGDPGPVLATLSGHVVSLLSGVNQIGIRQPDDREFVRISVGRGPSAVCEIPNGLGQFQDCVAVANRFDDSVSIVDLNQPAVVKTVWLSSDATLSDVARGEMLFHDASLSLDGWFSCASCHTDGHSCDELNDNLGDNTFGEPKRVLSLLGVAQTSPWAWNGGQTQLVDQIRKSMKLTMQSEEQRKIDEDEVFAIAAYLRTLDFAPGIDAARSVHGNQTGSLKVDETQANLVREGKTIFHNANCVECHAYDAFTSGVVQNVGLADLPDLELSPPSLRGVSQRRAWLHDGRAKSLRDVFATAKHQSVDFTRRELDALVAYLRSL
ncbi:MAG: c-type cytochrome [Planctomycetales bacterium]|nr:c-type cytochrome [Planctomycetales bacterium]